jgi:hypothetical protein
VAPAVLPLLPTLHGWQVFIDNNQSGPDYETEDAARAAAKRAGGVPVIVTPQGKRYFYYKQKHE